MSELDTILFLTYLIAVLYLIWMSGSRKKTVVCAVCHNRVEESKAAKYGSEWICDRCETTADEYGDLA